MMPSIFDYLSREEVAGLAKLAEKEHIKHPIRHGLATVGKGLLGFGAGSAGGYAIGHLANAVFEKTTGKELTPQLLVPAASLVGAGLGMAYSLYKSKENEELQRAFQAHRDNAKGSIPGK